MAVSRMDKDRIKINSAMNKPAPDKVRVAILFLFLIPFALIILLSTGCSTKPSLRVMAADSLTHSFSRICEKFKQENPDCDIILETQGSILLSRMALIRPCDVLAVADHRLVRQILDKESEWVIRFARTEMVLVWSTQSKASAEIKTENWPEILLREDIELGLANPQQDPCGYFTILCWKLAERYFGGNNKTKDLAKKLEEKVPEKKLAFDSGKLLARLQSFSSDYVFAYKCQAEDMHLPYLNLPAELNLGDNNLNDNYRKVSTKVPDYRGSSKEIQGTTIELGVTIPASCRNKELAEKFVKFLISEAGTKELVASSFEVVNPPAIDVWGQYPEFMNKEKNRK
jgi:molybdate/tungstate transport system substrate-binding protein